MFISRQFYSTAMLTAKEEAVFSIYYKLLSILICCQLAQYLFTNDWLGKPTTILAGTVIILYHCHI